MNTKRRSEGILRYMSEKKGVIRKGTMGYFFLILIRAKRGTTWHRKY